MNEGGYRIGKKAYMQQYREASRAKISCAERAWRARNPAIIKRINAVCKYKITVEEYERLMNTRICEICGGPPSGKDKYLSIDHNHETGRVRGMLCRKCNSALGLSGDSTEILEKMIAYLRKHE